MYVFRKERLCDDLTMMLCLYDCVTSRAISIDCQRPKWMRRLATSDTRTTLRWFATWKCWTRIEIQSHRDRRWCVRGVVITFAKIYLSKRELFIPSR